MARNRRAAERTGRLAEQLAAALLVLKGYRIIGRRLRGPVIEIDLLARRRDTLIAVEVKWRRHPEDALQSITPAKLRALSIALQAEAGRRGHGGPLRVDFIALSPWRFPVHMISVTA